MSDQLIKKGKKRRADIVTVSGGKGGIGKTFFTVNFAVELSKRGYRVLIFDGDINLSNVNILLHIYDPSKFRDFLNGNIPINDVILRGVGGVDVIYAGEDIDSLLNMNDESIKKVSEGLESLESQYDFIIIDTQAGINDFNINLITGADRVIMIANQEVTSLVDLYKVIKVISKSKSNIKYEIVINRVNRPDVAGMIYKKIHDTVTKFKVKSNLSFIGYVIEDSKRVLESIQKQIPFVILHEDNPISECFKMITNNFLRNRRQKNSISFLSILLGRG